ncbi:Na+-dependent transporter [Acuticoccus sediminis]|uniref:Na+-dependent transporter n=1 Tax=Acuticoccus sediminis TaxID=2184697 RepID=A0A8B2P075_9HYPH|nr:Na+-dependent transporter [Acuticoccus sediminis]RAI03364.1 Na+-dependent transporter [Acuticoccus sediminis]
MLTRLVAGLSWLGRRGPAALVVLMLVGMALPPLGAILRPYVGEGVFALLVLAFMRIDPERLKATVRRPGTALLSLGWTMLAVPLCAYVGLTALGVDESAPDLYLSLMLQSVTMPMMATPSIVMMIGLDGTIALVGIVLAGLTMPVLAPAILGVAGVPIELEPTQLAILLAGTLAGSAALGLLVRRVVGAARIQRNREAIDGMNVMCMFVFAVAVMGDVIPSFLADPWYAAGLTLVAFAANVGLMMVSWLVLRPAGGRTALAMAVTASQRNMGLMLAVAGSALPGTVWLYVALGQFPIYLAPVVLKRVATYLK